MNYLLKSIEKEFRLNCIALKFYNFVGGQIDYCFFNLISDRVPQSNFGCPILMWIGLAYYRGNKLKCELNGWQNNVDLFCFATRSVKIFALKLFKKINLFVDFKHCMAVVSVVFVSNFWRTNYLFLFHKVVDEFSLFSVCTIISEFFKFAIHPFWAMYVWIV